MTTAWPTTEPDDPAAHPSALALEAAALDELSPARRAPVTRHLEGCARCRDRVAALREDNDRFACSITLPSEVAEISARVGAPPAPRRTWPAMVAGIAAVAALALVVVRRGGGAAPPEDSVDGRLKGGLRFEVVHRAADGQQRWLRGGEQVAPGDGLRFRVRSDRDGFVAVLALDTAQVVSVYAPNGEWAAPLSAQALEVLPGSVVLDGTLGPERIVALVCNERRSLGELVAAAQAALAAAHGEVAAVGTLVPACREASLLVHKAAP